MSRSLRSAFIDDTFLRVIEEWDEMATTEFHDVRRALEKDVAKGRPVNCDLLRHAELLGALKDDFARIRAVSESFLTLHLRAHHRERAEKGGGA